MSLNVAALNDFNNETAGELLVKSVYAGSTMEYITIQEGVKYRTFPAVKIGLLAVDRRTKRLGVRLMEWAIDYVITEVVPIIGVRFITVDALYDFDVDPAYDASGFYEKLGFEFADPIESLPPVNPYRTMYLDLKPLMEALAIEESDEDHEHCYN
jgi:GNAT superfamily N-acetyltransferase